MTTNDHDNTLDRDEAWPVDGLDRLIASAARDYHAPPPSAAVPRDAMWAAIVAARIPAAPDAAPAVVRPAATTPVVAIASRRHDRASRRAWWGLAAAAAIFLATGVAVGRWSARPGVASGPSAASQVATTAPAVAPATHIDSTITAPTPGDRAGTTPVALPSALPARPAQVAAATARRAPRDGARRDDAYDVALEQHFAQAEALLVSYRADTLDVALDGRLAQWARPLLGDTRLLLDSPAAADPRRRRLLEDLELVLAQVARLAPAPRDSAGADSTARGDRAERQLIDGTIRHSQLLPRLRTLMPAAGSDL